MSGDQGEQCLDAGAGRGVVEEGVVQQRGRYVEAVLGDHPHRGRPDLVQGVRAADDGTQVAGAVGGDTETGEIGRQPRDVRRRARRQPQQQRPGGIADAAPGQLLDEFDGRTGGAGLVQRGRGARGHGQPRHHRQPEGHQPVHRDAVRTQRVRVQSAGPSLAVRHQSEAGGLRRRVDAGAGVGDVHPWLPRTSCSSRASSSARLMPRTSSSSWCSRIHTVWYESHRGRPATAGRRRRTGREPPPGRSDTGRCPRAAAPACAVPAGWPRARPPAARAPRRRRRCRRGR